MKFWTTTTAITCGLLADNTLAQSSIAGASCSPTLSASYAAPSVADGYVARLVANNLTSPRGIKFDSQGALLVVEKGVGITALSLVDAGRGCISVGGRKTVVTDSELNHGIEISPNGSTLYASTSDVLYSWDYSPQRQSNTSEPKVLINEMVGTNRVNWHSHRSNAYHSCRPVRTIPHEHCSTRRMCLV
jgi:hypothetical protein